MEAALIVGIARILDLGFALVEAGIFNRNEVVLKVNELYASGLTSEQVGDALENLRKAAHADAVKANEGG